MRFELGKYLLDIDIERTKAFYAYAEKITDGCICQGCRNYAEWATSLSTEPKWTLARMGIFLEKAAEVYVNHPNDDGSLFYGGFYHLCGRIVQGNEPWRQMAENVKTFNEDAFVSLAENYQVAFTEEIALLEKNFPTPVIQMEIMANVPFILPEKCDY